MKTCEEIHPCDLDTKGGCDQTCNKNGKSAECECTPPDYTLNADGKSCDKGRDQNVYNLFVYNFLVVFL